MSATTFSDAEIRAQADLLRKKGYLHLKRFLDPSIVQPGLIKRIQEKKPFMGATFVESGEDGKAINLLVRDYALRLAHAAGLDCVDQSHAQLPMFPAGGLGAIATDPGGSSGLAKPRAWHLDNLTYNTCNRTALDRARRSDPPVRL